MTITGDFEGQKLASAYWKHISFDISGGADIGAQFLALAGEQVTEEERRQIEQLGSLLEGQNPMAEIFGQMTGVPTPFTDALLGLSRLHARVHGLY